MGVIPPVRTAVEARRLIDPSAIMIARSGGAPLRTPPSARARS